MTVPLIDRTIGAQAIEIATPFNVGHPRALGALDHQIERVIVVRAPGIFARDQSVSRGQRGSHMSREYGVGSCEKQRDGSLRLETEKGD